MSDQSAGGRFAGQVAVVTGAGNGIGRGLGRAARRRGALAVVVVDIDGDAAERAAAALPGGAIAVTADVSDEGAQVDAYIEAAVGRLRSDRLPSPQRRDFRHLRQAA